MSLCHFISHSTIKKRKKYQKEKKMLSLRFISFAFEPISFPGRSRREATTTTTMATSAADLRRRCRRRRRQQNQPARAQIKKRIFSLLIQKDIISSKSRDSHCFYCCACFAFSSWPWCVITVIVARKFFISWHFAQNNRPTGAFFIASKPFCNDNRVSSDCLVIIDARTKHPSRPL